MNSSDFWDSTNNDSTSHHLVQLQETIPQEELLDSLLNVQQFNFNEEEDLLQFAHEENITGSNSTNNTQANPSQIANNTTGSINTSNHNGYNNGEQPSLEQIQKVYYVKGLQGIESLQLLDLLPLANWKLSLAKPGFGLEQLREDSPDTFWQLDGSNGNQNNGNGNANVNGTNNLQSPHSITIQFAKKVLIERISLFTNFLIDELYTPLKIQILAGLLDGWDIREVCLVTFNKPIGWLHIIFNGIRGDGVLKCFIIKLVVLLNHQDGKDTHIRAVKVFGKKAAHQQQGFVLPTMPKSPKQITSDDLLRDFSGLEHSGILLNGRDSTKESIDIAEEAQAVLENVGEVIGFNSGFQSRQMKSISSIR